MNLPFLLSAAVTGMGDGIWKRKWIQRKLPCLESPSKFIHNQLNSCKQFLKCSSEL